MRAVLFKNLDDPQFKYQNLTYNVRMKATLLATRRLTQFQSCVFHSSKTSNQTSTYHTWSQHSKPVTSCQAYFLSTVNHSKTKFISKHNAYISLFFCLPSHLANENMIFDSCKNGFLNSFFKRY